ncbi:MULTISPECIES: glutathione peroxidase [unclassified Methylobacterium]|jgi:glutathione peroxidase|uniref:glutathione peroxidase n=1 Tax=unclassified Methylobacterium TaxID=2615210 RepID=UPI0013548FC3|nr:glutathione peroxidase [Methylobacterium sp. 2A]MWV23908.1 glutathione peroxidase [Methylobacterium sp. 2A]
MMLLRREALILIGAGLAGGARAAESARAADFAFETPEGGPMPLSAYAGKPILVVNTATACGYAGQLSGLQALWTRFGGRGLTVIGVPSPDFGNQEPLDGPAIAEAARKNHGVTFPLTAKTHVKMPGAHPFYRWAAAERPAETPRWNFHKYLIARDGTLAAAFATQVEPTDPRVISGIAAALDRA